MRLLYKLIQAFKDWRYERSCVKLRLGMYGKVADAREVQRLSEEVAELADHLGLQRKGGFHLALSTTYGGKTTFFTPKDTKKVK